MALYDESMWANNAFIKDFGFDFNGIFLTDLNNCSYHGIKLAEEMGDDGLINSKFGDKLYGNCHDLANYMALKYNLGVETSFVKISLGIRQFTHIIMMNVMFMMPLEILL